MGNLFDISSGKTVTPAETRRSGLGELLSDKMPGILSALLGDVGVRYDRLSKPNRLVALLSVGALAVVGVVGLRAGASAVGSALDLDGEKVAAYQESNVVGPHAVVSFENTNPDRYIWGYPNTNEGNPTFGRVPVGAKVVCAPVVGKMAFVQAQDGNRGFVSFDPDKTTNNPEGCPAEATVALNTETNQYGLVDASGKPVNFPVGQIREP